MKLTTTIKRIQGTLSPDLLRPRYRNCTGLEGHCYVAAEALWHLTDRRLDVYFARYRDRHRWHTHWWLQDGEQIWDPTAGQFPRGFNYRLGRRGGFLTRNPSIRAREVIRRVRVASQPKGTMRHYRRKRTCMHVATIGCQNCYVGDR